MRILKLPAWSSAILAGITAYLAVVLTHNLNDSRFLWLLAPALICGFISIMLFRKLEYLKLIMSLRNKWGSKQRPDKKQDFSKTRTLFDLLNTESAVFTIDDRTWQDLNMDHVFAEIDRTLTDCGRQCLYNMLRRPLFDHNELDQRAELISLFQEKHEIREAVQVILSKIGGSDGIGVVSLLWDPPVIWRWRYSMLYSLMFCCALLSPLAFFVSIAHGIIAFNMVFIVNSFIYYKVQKKISIYFNGVKSLSRLLYWGKKLNLIEAHELSRMQSKLRPAISKVASYWRVTSIIGLDSAYPADPIVGTLLQYISIYFLSEIRSFYRAVDIINKNRQSFRTIFQTIGDLDAYQAVASYRESLHYYCEPTLKSPKSDIREIRGIDMYHPLLKNPVANTLTIQDKGILITGSNMSGKSTFLRTIGINALFAQTVFTCFAREYKSEFVKLLTVIGRVDNIIEGKSYYLVEAQSILRIIAETKQHEKVTTLAILDEMYRGTNAEERIKAGCNVLRYLVHQRSFVLAATHDLELTKMLVSDFDNYHFREQVAEHGLSFDYTLKPGPSTTKNAIRLLKILGYPAEITGRTNDERGNGNNE